MSRVIATVLIAAIVAGVYAALIAMHVAAIRGKPSTDGPARPRLAIWLAARFGQIPEAVPVDRRLARSESDVVHQLMTGALDWAAYQAEMSALAARDAVDDPLEVPR